MENGYGKGNSDNGREKDDLGPRCSAYLPYLLPEMSWMRFQRDPIPPGGGGNPMVGFVFYVLCTWTTLSSARKVISNIRRISIYLAVVAAVTGFGVTQAGSNYNAADPISAINTTNAAATTTSASAGPQFTLAEEEREILRAIPKNSKEEPENRRGDFSTVQIKTDNGAKSDRENEEALTLIAPKRPTTKATLLAPQLSSTLSDTPSNESLLMAHPSNVNNSRGIVNAGDVGEIDNDNSNSEYKVSIISEVDSVVIDGVEIVSEGEKVNIGNEVKVKVGNDENGESGVNKKGLETEEVKPKEEIKEKDHKQESKLIQKEENENVGVMEKEKNEEKDQRIENKQQQINTEMVEIVEKLDKDDKQEKDGKSKIQVKLGKTDKDKTVKENGENKKQSKKEKVKEEKPNDEKEKKEIEEQSIDGDNVENVKKDKLNNGISTGNNPVILSAQRRFLSEQNSENHSPVGSDGVPSSRNNNGSKSQLNDDIKLPAVLLWQKAFANKSLGRDNHSDTNAPESNFHPSLEKEQNGFGAVNLTGFTAVHRKRSNQLKVMNNSFHTQEEDKRGKGLKNQQLPPLLFTESPVSLDTIASSSSNPVTKIGKSSSSTPKTETTTNSNHMLTVHYNDQSLSEKGERNAFDEVPSSAQPLLTESAISTVVDVGGDYKLLPNDSSPSVSSSSPPTTRYSNLEAVTPNLHSKAITPANPTTIPIPTMTTTTRRIRLNFDATEREINSLDEIFTTELPFQITSESVNGFLRSNVSSSGDGLWPVKHAAVVEGDVILGGLMMVHEREDSITCGPIMPQGGIQALEAMLYTLDRINDINLLPNISLGAHILDDCDKDTYGLEMAVDFIKGKKN